MKILLANPNTTAAVTDLLMASAETVVAADTRLEAITAPRGVPYIATRAEAAIGGAVVLEMLAAHRAGVDAAIVAAFGDPGLGAARELFPFPVVGMAEAAMLTACMLGRSFSIVSFSQTLEPWYRECVAHHGMLDRLASIRMLDESFASIADVQNEKEDLLVALAERSVAADSADVVILAGAPLAGLAQRVAPRIPVPVVDCISAAVKQAEALVALAPRKATVGTFRRPAAKPSIGLAEPLGRWIAHDD